MAKNSGFDFLLGVAVGTIIGAAAGLLLAPAEGSEARKVISDKTKQAVEATKQTAGKVKVIVTDTVDKLKDNLSNKFEDVFVDEDVCDTIIGEDVLPTEAANEI